MRMFSWVSKFNAQSSAKAQTIATQHNQALKKIATTIVAGATMCATLFATMSMLAPKNASASPDKDKIVATLAHVDSPHAFWEDGNFVLRGHFGEEPYPLIEDTVIWVGKGYNEQKKSNYTLTLPADNSVSFAGKPGQVLYRSPAVPGWTNSPNWVGMGADQDIPIENFRSKEFALDLLDVKGPGRMEMFNLRAPQPPTRLLSSTSDQFRSYWMTRGTHTHNETTFTKPGRYELTYRVSARDNDGTLITSKPQTIVWQVGGNNPSTTSILDIRAAYEAAANYVPNAGTTTVSGTGFGAAGASGDPVDTSESASANGDSATAGEATASSVNTSDNDAGAASESASANNAATGLESGANSNTESTATGATTSNSENSEATASVADPAAASDDEETAVEEEYSTDAESNATVESSATSESAADGARASSSSAASTSGGAAAITNGTILRSAAPTANSATTSPTFTLSPYTPSGTPQDDDNLLTNMEFNTNNTADSGTVVFLIDGYYLNEVKVVKGKASFPELLGDEAMKLQAIYIPTSGPTGRWISQPIDFQRAGTALNPSTDNATVSTSASAETIMTEIANPVKAFPATVGSTDEAVITITGVSSESDPNVVTWKATSPNKQLYAHIIGGAYDTNYPSDVPDCTVEFTMADGEGSFTTGMDFCGSSTPGEYVVKFVATPHPVFSNDAVTITDEQWILGTATTITGTIPAVEGSDSGEGEAEGDSEDGGDADSNTGSTTDSNTTTDADTSCTKAKPCVFDRGHTDIFNVTLNDKDGINLNIKEDITGRGVIQEPENVILKVNRQAYTAADVLTYIGEDGYVLPQSQDMRLLWPGWETLDITSGGYGPVDFHFEEVSGPGKVYGFISGNLGGAPIPVTDREKGEVNTGATIAVPSPTHAHLNWVFTEPGTYTMKVYATAKPVATDGDRAASEPVSSAVRTYTWVVERDDRHDPAPNEEEDANDDSQTGEGETGGGNESGDTSETGDADQTGTNHSDNKSDQNATDKPTDTKNTANDNTTKKLLANTGFATVCMTVIFMMSVVFGAFLATVLLGRRFITPLKQ